MASPEGSGPFRWLGGGYFFDEEKDFTFDGYYDQDLSSWGMLLKKVRADENFAEWLPKFSIDYRFSPDFMIYASAARGYKSGGFNSYVASAVGTPYDPEYTWNYEVGIKSAWLDKQVSSTRFRKSEHIVT